MTGATRGIGASYARELAKRKMNLILIGRNEEINLADVGFELENDYGIKVELIELDLATEGQHIYTIIEGT